MLPATQKYNYYVLFDQVVICDESHNMKNKKSKTAGVAIDLIKSAARCVLLSGTPAVNKPSEVQNLLDAFVTTSKCCCLSLYM